MIYGIRYKNFIIKNENTFTTFIFCMKMNASDILSPEIWRMIYIKILQTQSAGLLDSSNSFMAVCNLFRNIASEFILNHVTNNLVKKALIHRHKYFNDIDIQNELFEKSIGDPEWNLSPFIFFQHPQQVFNVYAKGWGFSISQLYHDYFISLGVSEAQSCIKMLNDKGLGHFIIGCTSEKCPMNELHALSLETR